MAAKHSKRKKLTDSKQRLQGDLNPLKVIDNKKTIILCQWTTHSNAVVRLFLGLFVLCRLASVACRFRVCKPPRKYGSFWPVNSNNSLSQKKPTIWWTTLQAVIAGLVAQQVCSKFNWNTLKPNGLASQIRLHVLRNDFCALQQLIPQQHMADLGFGIKLKSIIIVKMDRAGLQL